jgi:hypothetical protein
VEHGTRNLGAAAVAFALAAATKITSLAVPGSAVVALALGGRWRPAWRLGTTTLAGVALVVVTSHALSGGRAIPLWREGLLAGAGGGGMIQAALRGEFLNALGASRFLVVMLILAVAAIAAGLLAARRAAGDSPAARHRHIPLVPIVFLGVTATTLVTLSSPGTIVLNQVVEWIAIGLLVVAWTTAQDRSRPLLWPAALLIVTLWASAQDLVRARDLAALDASGVDRAARQAVVELIRQSPGPVLAEAPLWPVLAGQQPILLDAFSIRVAAKSRPDVLADLLARLEARAFTRVVLQVDPDTPRGKGWYEHVHFGSPVIERVLANYELETTIGDIARVYRPR